jgi:serine/threonine protein kinase
MDYISGGDLAFHLEQKTRFNEKEVRFITAEIVLALEHLHSCGIVYRDLKLENVLLDKDGHVCLTDFGLSKELESISATTKTVCGTPTYLAPEVLLGQAYGNAIDWWSLGVVLFELFTGMNPFDSKDFDSVLNNILHSQIVVPDYVPKEGKELIEALLQRNPQKRLCSGPTGSAEIQNHNFYKSIEWKKMMFKQVKAPFVPQAKDNFDPSLQAENIEPPPGKPNADKNLEFPDSHFQYVSKSIL